MAEKLLKIKGVFDPGDVQSGLDALTGNLRGVGKAAIDAAGGKEAWAEFGKTLAAVDPKFKEIEKLAFAAASAIEQMGRAGENVGGIENGAKKAIVNLVALRETIEKAEHAGATIGPEIKQSLQQMETAVERGVKKARDLGDMYDKAGLAIGEFGSRVKTSAQDMSSLERGLDSVATSTKAMLAAMASQAASQAFGAVKDAVAESIRVGIDYNKMLQDSKGGLAALILANYDMRNSQGGLLEGQEKLKTAFELAGELQRGLADDARKTAAEYGDLVTAFQSGLPNAVKVGITDFNDLREIMLAASQAANVLQVDSSQLAQEFASMFKFEPGPDNKLSNALGLTKDKLNELLASGQSVAGFLKEKLAPYSEAAAASLGNLSVTTSNLRGDMKELAGEITKPLFDVIAKSAEDFRGKLGEVKTNLSGTGEDLASMGASVGPLVEAFGKLAVVLTRLGAAAGAGGAEKFAAPLKTLVDALSKLVESVGAPAFEVAMAFLARQLGIIIPAVEEIPKGIVEVTTSFDRLTDSTNKAGHATAKNTDATNKNTEGKKEAIDPMKAVWEQLEKEAAAYDKLTLSVNAARQAESARAQEQAEFDQAMQGTYETRKAMLDSMTDTLKTMTITPLEFTQATDAAIESLVKMADKFAEIDERLGRSAANMVDYAANIRAAYETGLTSMIGVLGQLDEAIQQMMILKMRNAGTAFEEEINRMLTAYQQLRDAIASGQVKKTEQMRGLFI